MKMTYIIVGILLLVGLAIYLANRPNKSKADSKPQVSRDTSSPKEYHTQTNTFHDLRAMAFRVTPEQLQLVLPKDKSVVYGVILDWEMGGATATIVSYQTGDASLYLSSGGGVIGGGQHEHVSHAAKQFVSLAQGYLDKATKTSSNELPTLNQVKFHLLTNQGILVGQDNIKNFENGSSAWLPLFEEGNKVLTEIRLISEKQ